MNRLDARALVALILALLLASPAFAQTPQPQQTQPSPLVTQTSNPPTTVWELTIPQRPDDRTTRLTYQRMWYGLSLIQGGDPDQLREFISKFTAVKPGQDAWMEIEELVLLYTNGRAQNDQINESPLTAKDIRIITSPTEIRQYYGLDPDSFKPMEWGLDPLGRGVVKVRRDILKNIKNYDNKIDELYAQNPRAGEAIKQALRACISQAGNSETCFDASMRDYPFIQRNHGKGRGSVGENESYFKGTNRPNAHATFFFVPDVGWKAVGWECFDNPLDLYTSIRIPASVTTRLFQNPAKLACSISPPEVVLHSLGDVAIFKLTVTPPQQPEDIKIVWRRGNKELAPNAYEAQVLGSDLEMRDVWSPVEARVAVGATETTCGARVMLQFPAQQVTSAEPPRGKPEEPSAKKKSHKTVIVIVGIVVVGAAAGGFLVFRGHGGPAKPACIAAGSGLGPGNAPASGSVGAPGICN